MILLSLILSTTHIEQKYLLTCEQYDWLVQGVLEANTLSPSEKTDIIFRFIDGTNSICFGEKT